MVPRGDPSQGIRPIASTPEELGRHLADEVARHEAYYKTLDIE